MVASQFLTFLKKNNLSLYHKVRQFAGIETVSLLSTRTNFPTLRVVNKQKEFLLYSKYDPEKQVRTDLAKYAIPEDSNVVLLGFGLGYYAKILLTDYKLTNLLVIPFDLENLSIASSLATNNYLVIDKRLTFIDPEDSLDSYITQINNLHISVSNLTIIRHAQLDLQFPEQFKIIKEKLFQALSLYLSHQASNVSRIHEQQKCVAKNLKILAGLPSLKSLLNKFKDQPCVIIGPGPTLNQSLAKLNELKKKVLLLALDTAIPSLITNNIIPHLVISTDFADTNIKNLVPLLNLKVKGQQPVLIADVTTSYAILKEYQGPIYVYNNGSSLINYFADYLPDFPLIPIKTSVSYAAMVIADYLNMLPIYLLGIDLSFTPDSSYAQSSQKQIFIKKDAQNRYWKNNTLLKKIKDINGNTVLQDEILANQYLVLKQLITDKPELYINISDGGILKTKKVATVADCIAVLPYHDFAADLSSIKNLRSEKSIVNMLTKSLSGLDLLQRNLETLIAKAEKEKKFSNAYKNFQNQIRLLLEGDKQTSKLLSSIQSILYHNIKHQEQLLGLTKDETEKAVIYQKIDNLYITAYLSSLNFFRDLFKQLLRDS